MHGKVQTTLSWVLWPLTHQNVQALLSAQSPSPVLFHTLKGIDEILQKHDEVAATSVKCVSAWKTLISVILTETKQNKKQPKQLMETLPTLEGWVAYKSSILLPFAHLYNAFPDNLRLTVYCFITDNPVDMGRCLSHWGPQSLS